ncbi:hypothetical protein AB9Q10_16235 [Streptomyces krungchingensis]
MSVEEWVLWWAVVWTVFLTFAAVDAPTLLGIAVRRIRGRR